MDLCLFSFGVWDAIIVYLSILVISSIQGQNISWEQPWGWCNRLSTSGFEDFQCRFPQALSLWMGTVGEQSHVSPETCDWIWLSVLSHRHTCIAFVSLPHSTAGMLLGRWWVVPGFWQIRCLELRPKQFNRGFIRAENIVSHSGSFGNVNMLMSAFPLPARL